MCRIGYGSNSIQYRHFLSTLPQDGAIHTVCVDVFVSFDYRLVGNIAV